MIVPMKKVTLLALGSEQNQALTALRGLGVMQVETARRVPSETSQQLGEEFELLAATFGFDAEQTGGFTGWKYDPNSKLRATGMALFEKMFGRKMEIQATHGGLECGEFIGKIPDMDIMTVAPTCVGAHTTEEAMNIESFGKVMDYLVALLDALCNE